MDIKNTISFESRTEFRRWLSDNALSDDGIWVRFCKDRKANGLTAAEALEEALCFGWIDGVMQSINERYYAKYFKQRSQSSRFSAKNKSLVETLEAKGLMTDLGRAKMEYAAKNGLLEVKDERPRLTEEQIQQFEEMLLSNEIAYGNFMKMTKSVRTSYMSSYYFGAKTEDGKKKRFDTIVERLNLNMNPMESIAKKLAQIEAEKK
jgi:uncharacterized protein YdeI (YjbR/CyaY-like superfamily)